ncbi:MAG TPA: ABC transporter ATP-binding protein [Verrucomicrobiota bacterium]|nr:ABC transporter ATP-binding protein [Verrucomicrobiota bacterium]HNU50535.1 ABC transporter ATP-binding protein [Verrucomicrobiota bacterium]
MSIVLDRISKRFGPVIAVDSVSLSVEEGELVALLGPSGGGKTTILRMIAGLEMPTEGEIIIRNRRVTDLRVQERNIGFVFQNYALFKHMNVFRNIAFGLRVKRWRKAEIEARVGELLHLLELEGLAQRLPHQLSGGQRQRVAIARALAPRPSVLLLDEPFGAVDARIRQELREWLVRLHQELNVTTLFVTHDQEEAMEVARRIAIFSNGRLEQIDTPQTVYEEPANEFVARFIGVMNILEGQVHNGVARAGDIELPAPGCADGARVRIGFRPYAVQVSPDPGRYRYQAVLLRTYFMGIMHRLELATPSGLRVRCRITKEEYSNLGLRDSMNVSFQIRSCRVLAGESAESGPARPAEDRGASVPAGGTC